MYLFQSQTLKIFIKEILKEAEQKLAITEKLNFTYLFFPAPCIIQSSRHLQKFLGFLVKICPAHAGHRKNDYIFIGYEIKCLFRLNIINIVKIVYIHYNLLVFS